MNTFLVADSIQRPRANVERLSEPEPEPYKFLLKLSIEILRGDRRVEEKKIRYSVYENVHQKTGIVEFAE